jgi:hypothetical protein
MKTRLLLTSGLFAALATLGHAQYSLAISTVATGSAGFGDATGSGRFMSSNGPAHLGGGNISGYVPMSSGGAYNGTGDMIVGDNSGNSFNFSLILQFTTTADFRAVAQGGGTILLTGKTLYGVDDGFGGTAVKTTGNVDWAPVSVSLNGYGNSATGTFSDTNNFRAHGAFNNTDAENNSVNAYTLGPAIAFDSDPYVADATFTVDVTALFNNSGALAALSATNDRVMMGLSAWAPDGSVILSADGIADRIAFQPGSFQLTAVPEPSTFAAILGFVALAGVMIRRRLRNR